MKNFYFTKLKTIATMAFALFLSVGLFAQSDITWTGANSSSYADITNWDPQGNMDGNWVIIGYADSYTYPCVVDADADITIGNLMMTGWTQEILNPDTEDADTIMHAPGELTIDMAEGTWFENSFSSDAAGQSAGIYFTGTMNVIGGNYYFSQNKNFYMEDSAGYINIDCDTFQIRHLTLMGKKNNAAVAGQWTIMGHSLVLLNNGVDRFPSISTASQVVRPSWIIKDEAVVSVNGDRLDYLVYQRDSGLIASTADRDVVITYDPVADRTFVRTRLKTAFEIEPTDRQILTAGEDGEVIRAVQNDGFASMESLEWKYGTVSGGPYDQSFSPAQTGDTIVPNFPVAGEYYLALEGMKGGTAYYTNEVSIGVASNKAVVSPETTQNIRLGQQGEMLTITEDGTVTGREWKYTTTPGGPYSSFDPAITGTEFTPNFTEVGTYFVVCMSEIDGSTATTKEVQFNITAYDAAALNLTFTGAVDNEAGDLFNWDPAAYINRNNLTVPADMNPVLTTAGNDTVANFSVGLGATFTINKPSLNDTLVYTADHNSSDGSYVIEGGVFVKTKSYFRLYSGNTTFTVKNDAKVYIYGTALLLSGDKTPGASSVGANLYLQDNAEMIIDTDYDPGRICPTADYSNFYLQDNARYIIIGDARSFVSPLLQPQIDGEDTTVQQKFITPEGYAPYMVYDPVEDKTIVTARDLSAFAIEQTITQIVGLNQETNPLTLINTSAYSSFEWQYSTSAAGPWSSFETPKTGETATFAFDSASVVFVRCLADGSVASSNAIAINTIEIPVTPAGPIYAEVNTDGPQMEVELPDDVTGTEWKYSTTSGSGYEGFFPMAQTDTLLTPNFDEVGVYYVVFEAIAIDDNGQDVVVYSNEVKIVVGDVAINKVELGNVSVYPNPARDAFFVDGGDLKSYELQVINLQGAVVYNKSFNQVEGAQKVNFNTSGFYMIKLIADEGVKVGSLVIE